MFEKQKKERYRLPISIKGLLYDSSEKKFLLLKLKDNNYFAKKHGPWEIAGGKMEESDDNIEEVLNREIKEELGKNVEVEIKTLLSAIESSYSEIEKVIFLIHLVEYKGGEIELSDEHGEYAWKTAKEVELSKEYKQWVKDVVKKAEEYLKAQDNLEGWKRCQADFDNYRKRQDESRKQLKDFMLEDIALQILPVVDNFEMSLQHIPEDQKKGAWVQGILHIQRQLETVLKDNGIEEIEAKIGDEFDPNFHEAIHQETEKSEQKSGNKIKKIISKGYRIGDKVIRAVKVIVG